jgi:predicted enzyme related to lactoylglutathione lyase
MNALNWFEIPAQDFEATVNFYEKLLQIKLHREDFGGMPHGVFPYKEGAGVGGAVAQVPYAKAGSDGIVIYLNVPSLEILDAALAQVEALGGALVMPKTFIGDPGYMALIRDPEGNRVGLNVMSAS